MADETGTSVNHYPVVLCQEELFAAGSALIEARGSWERGDVLSEFRHIHGTQGERTSQLEEMMPALTDEAERFGLAAGYALLDVLIADICDLGD